MRKASFWRRLLAFLVDLIICNLISTALSAAFNLSYTFEQWCLTGFYYLYNIVMEYYFQATWGKTLLKIRVIRDKKQKPDLLHVIYRNVGKMISALPLFYGYLRILAPHRLQTMHDELGKCYVIKTIKE